MNATLTLQEDGRWEEGQTSESADAQHNPVSVLKTVIVAIL